MLIISEYKGEEEEILMQITKKDILTIPNILSLFRIILAVLIPLIYYSPELEQKIPCLIIIILVSGLTDFLDGRIARRFHMISELGKILDPIADKITQAVLLICLLSRFKWIKIILVLFFAKEILQGLIGFCVLVKTKENQGAKWYGKVNTAVFYLVVLLLIFVPDMPGFVANTLLCISGGFMLLSFCMYLQHFRRLLRRKNG